MYEQRKALELLMLHQEAILTVITLHSAISKVQLQPSILLMRNTGGSQDQIEQNVQTGNGKEREWHTGLAWAI